MVESPNEGKDYTLYRSGCTCHLGDFVLRNTCCQNENNQINIKF